MIKSGSIIARFLHKWVGLIVGIQVMIWLASGLYMVIIDLDFIHGDPLVRNMNQTINIPETGRVSVATLREKYPSATRFGVQTVADSTYFTVITADDRYLIDPETADVVSPLGEQSIRKIAQYHFNGQAQIRSASLITSSPPMEIQTRRLPLWRVDFDDRFSTSFYIDPYNGVLVTRRHQYWRIFDFMWMLHIMDYDERMDAHNPLVIFTQIVGLIFGISGLWLLFYSFSRRKQKVGADR